MAQLMHGFSVISKKVI